VDGSDDGEEVDDEKKEARVYIPPNYHPKVHGFRQIC
jgi:hypothetical protein